MQKLIIRNLECSNCAYKLEKAIQKTPGVDYARIDNVTNNLFIDASDLGLVRETINRIHPGVKVSNSSDDIVADKENIDWKLVGPLLLAVALFILGLVFYDPLTATPMGIGEYLVFGIAYGISGWGVIRNAGRNIIRGQVFDENFLMTIATIGAIIIGEIPEAAGVMIFYMVGEFLQEQSVRRSRQSIKSLLQARPDRATIIRDGKPWVVHPEIVEVGDMFIVKPGERIPLDGRIIQGESYIDSSPLTGEAIPKAVREGDSIFAGAINKSAVITLIAQRPFKDTSISKIVELVEKSGSNKAKPERFITRFARIYSPIIFFSAIGVAIIPPLFFGSNLSEWIYRALVVLVISCPCALVISIPLGYFGGVGGASRRGILVKGSNFLDILASVKTLVFDKTGTLTKGNFKVTDIHPHNGFRKDEVLSYASQAEAGSNHPIAQSIRNACQDYDYDPDQEIKEIAGQGIKAIIGGEQIIVGNDSLLHDEAIYHNQEVCEILGTNIHVAVDGTYAGFISIVDELKQDTIDTIRRLRAIGVTEMVMLTGDKRETAYEISQNLGLDSFEADLLPQGKITALESIINKQNRKGMVGFVGDGINDAPALARADVGIAMGALGSEAAIEAADVVIMSESPGKIVEAIQIAKKTKSIVMQNIGLALIIKIGFIVLGVTGNATMWQAVFGDMGVALIAILNASRILGYKQESALSKV